MESSGRPPVWKPLLAFATVYLVWGCAYLSVRIGVQEVPPFLLAAIRFLVAGLVLYGWSIARGERSPSLRQWRSIFLLGFLIFVVDFGLVFWAQQRVPSGITAVMMAMIAIFIALLEIFILRTQGLTVRLAIALLIGIGGVMVLVSRSLTLGGAPIDRAGAVALIFAAMGMSVASVLMTRLRLPESTIMSSGAQMLAGGVLLTLISALLGEFSHFHPGHLSTEVWFALFYMTVPASIIAFPAYVWLIHNESPTKAGTYAYVNPVVAVLAGYFLGGEALASRTIVGSLLILSSVVAITTMKSEFKKSNCAAPIECLERK
jgi:drug/metabolite transporter (DMT)-like permease